MNAESGRANLVTQTETAYHRGILVAELAKVGQDHWRTTGDAFGLLLAADLFDSTATLFSSMPTVPDEEQFVRRVAQGDREMAALLREQAAAYQEAPRAFASAIDPTWAKSLQARERNLRDELAALRPKTPARSSAGFSFHPLPQRHTSRMSGLRLLPWLGLFLAAWAIGAALPRDWWTLPAIALFGCAVSMLFVRLGLHRLR